MTTLVQYPTLTEGNASRFLRKKWITDEPRITPAAFDLRERTPPESYVSFFIVDGVSDEDRKLSAINVIGARLDLNQQDGAITILEISECLDKINGEDINLISFRDEALPHCGLYYLSKDAAAILEAKTILCLIAKKKLYKLQKAKHLLPL